MTDTQIIEYINIVKAHTLENLISNIIENVHTNKSEQLLFLLSQIFLCNNSSFSNEQVYSLVAAIMKYIEMNYDKKDIKLFVKYFHKIFKIIKIKNVINEIKIELEWKLFYNIFFIYSYDTDNTLIDNTLRKVGPLFKSNFSNSDYEIIKQAFQFNLFHYKHIKHMKNAFKLLFTFVPNSYICQDWSIQKDVQNFLMNKTELFDYCCCFFYKI